MRIPCFGDSNTYGYDPRGYFGSRYAAEDRWTDLLAKQTGHEVINAGMNGREIPRKPDALTSTPADIYIVMLGTNDLLQGASAKDAAVRMDTLLHPNCNHILLIAPPPMKRGSWVPSDDLVKESILLAEEYKQLAQKRTIPFVDTRPWNIDLTFDGIHFTEAGHHTFASRLMEYI